MGKDFRKHWNEIVAGCKKHPFFTSSVGHEDNELETVFKERGRILHLIVYLIIAILIPTVICHGLISLLEMNVFYSIVLILIITCITSLCFFSVIKQKKIVFNKMTSELIIYYGTYLKSKNLALSSSEVAFELKYSDENVNEIVQLLMMHREQNLDGLKLIVSSYNSILPIFTKISDITGIIKSDRTIKVLELDDGSELSIHTNALFDSGEAHGNSLKFVPKNETYAILRPSINYYILYSTFILFGAVILFEFYIQSHQPRELLAEAILFITILFCLTIGFVGIIYGMWKRIVKIDITKNTMVVPHGLSGFWKQKIVFSLSDIVAIQICCNIVGGEGEEEDVYETNLVLNDGKRVNLITEKKYFEINNTANAIADFIKKPLIDHTVNKQ